jgi:hypothetical protein
MVDAQRVLVEMETSRNNVTAEENLAISCSLNGKELPRQGGGVAFLNETGNTGSALHIGQALFISGRNVDDIPIISLITPAVQNAEAVPQPFNAEFAQAAMNHVPTMSTPTACMHGFKLAFLKPDVSMNAKPTHSNSRLWL